MISPYIPFFWILIQGVIHIIDVPRITPEPILNIAELVPSNIVLGFLVENREYVFDVLDMIDIFNLCKLTICYKLYIFKINSLYAKIHKSKITV